MYFVGTFFRIMQDFRFVESEPAGPGARDEILKKEAKKAEKLRKKTKLILIYTNGHNYVPENHQDDSQ